MAQTITKIANQLPSGQASIEYRLFTDAFVLAVDWTVLPVQETAPGSGSYLFTVPQPAGFVNGFLVTRAPTGGNYPPAPAGDAQYESFPEEIVFPVIGLSTTIGTAAGSFLSADSYEIIRQLAGVDADLWPDARVQGLPFLGVAQAEATTRIPCNWAALDPLSQGWLRTALLYHVAALIIPEGNLGRTDDFRIGQFSLKTDDSGLLSDAQSLMGYANLYYANVILPVGIIPAQIRDSFPRPVIRRASVCGVGSRRLY